MTNTNTSTSTSTSTDVVTQWAAANVAAIAKWSAGNRESVALYIRECPPSTASGDAIRTPQWLAHVVRQDALEREFLATIAENYCRWQA